MDAFGSLLSVALWALPALLAAVAFYLFKSRRRHSRSEQGRFRRYVENAARRAL